MGFRWLVAAGLRAQLLQADAQRHGATMADGIARHVEQLPHQTHPVLDAAAVGVGPVIVFGQQELVGQVPHARVDVHDVESRLHRPLGAGGLPLEQLRDVRRIHAPRAQVPHEADMGRHPGHAGRRDRRDAAGAVQGARTTMPELDARQGTVTMHLLGHQGVRAYVLVVPQHGERQRRIIRARMHRHGARADDTPAALGLDSPESGTHVGQRIGHAAGMRHLIETVGSGDRTDAYRLEQDVEALIARHGGSPLSPVGRPPRVIDRSYSSNRRPPGPHPLDPGPGADEPRSTLAVRPRGIPESRFRARARRLRASAGRHARSIRARARDPWRGRPSSRDRRVP